MKAIKLKLVIILLVAIANCGLANGMPFSLKDDVNVVDPDDPNILINTSRVQQQPEFPEGEEALWKWIQDNIVYPKDVEIEGRCRVVVQFTVTKDGEIKDAKVVRGRHPDLDKEALRIVNAMPKWKPGKSRDEPIDVVYILPISFHFEKVHQDQQNNNN